MSEEQPTDTNNFWQLFCEAEGAVGAGQARKIEQMGALWYQLKADYPTIFKRAQELAEQFSNFQSSWFDEAVRLVREEGATTERFAAQKLEQQRLRAEMETVLRELFDLLVAKGVDPELLRS